MLRFRARRSQWAGRIPDATYGVAIDKIKATREAVFSFNDSGLIFRIVREI